MRIGELSTATGVSERSLRYYETQGLLHPQRSGNGYRHYPEHTADTVRIIRTLLDAGLSTSTISQLLPCVRLIGGRAVPCSDLLGQLHTEHQRIGAQIQSLAGSQQILNDVIAAAVVYPNDSAPFP
ncbi:MAG: MerR family transcriptional regulator [Pseudonocardiaceae bacterium]